MDYSKLSDNDLLALKNRDYSKISNEGLLLLKNNTLPQNKPNAPVRPKNKGIDLTPSGLIDKTSKGAVSAIFAPFTAMSEKIPLNEAFNKEYQKLEDIYDRNNFGANKVLSTINKPLMDAALYSKILPFKGEGFKATLGNNTIQGAAAGALENLKNGDNPTLDGITGGLTGGIVGGAIPILGKAPNGIKWIGNQYLEKVARLKPKTIEQVVKPNSKALDLSADEAQSLLLNTTERVRNAYNNILNEKGNAVGKLLQDLPETAQFKAKNLMDDYSKIYDNYSLSKNESLNPAKNATERELNSIKEMLYGDGKQRFNEFSESIKNLEFPKSYLETLKGRYKNTYHTKVLDNLNNDIVFAQRNFNANILDKLRKNPEILQNPQEIEKLEQEVAKYAHYPYEELNEQFYNKFYDAIEKGQILKEGENFVNPKELYDINKNISENMINWDKPGTNYKNGVLEQIYGTNADKISSLSPKLKKANKEFSDLMDFQKNEGIRRIINDTNNIDNASSALKNYNSTITKGNTNRNIQDLEQKLVDNGYQPFLNDIDDVNAAQNLLNSPETGINAKGGVDFAKLIVRPSLYATRWANRNNIPQYYENVQNFVRPVSDRFGELLPPLAAIGVSDLLYNNN